GRARRPSVDGKGRDGPRHPRPGGAAPEHPATPPSGGEAMSPQDPDRDALVTRLEWLRLLGVSDLPRPPLEPSHSAPGSTTERVAAPPPMREASAMGAGGQASLFAAGEAAAEPPSAPRRPRRDAAPASASPLAALPGPDDADAARALAMVRADIG